MWGIDGAGISWYVRWFSESEIWASMLMVSAISPISCGTHSIFRNTDDMSPTPMIACAGVTLDGLKLVRGDLRTTSSIGSTSGRGIAATTSSAAQSSGETGESGGTDNSASVGTSFGTVGVIAVGIAVPAISVMAGLTLLLL